MVKVYSKFVTNAALWLLAVPCVFAQALPAISAPPAANPQRSNSLPAVPLLGAGDQMVINIADLDEVKNLNARISSDGSLDLPLIGIVQAGGMTVPGLRSALSMRYAKYINNPQISIQLTSSQTQTVSVIGEVNAPSVQEITGPLTLLSAITKAGGIKTDAGPQVVLTRETKEGILPLPNAVVSSAGGFSRATLPLDDLLAEKTPENNILLRSGDVVSVPKGSLVYVIGDVHRSGGFPLRSSGSISLIEALALAEGLGPNAKSKNAKILRPVEHNSEKRTEIPVDISEVLAGKRGDPQMFADDILFVPTSAAKSTARRAAEAILQVSTGVLIYR